jgi:ubiquinone/menaquinone biosynthesis C-methylase UbiE
LETDVETHSVVQKSDEIRGHLHSMWASVADSWAQQASYAEERGAVVTTRLLELAAPKPGERVLELACGPGAVGLAAAELVGPTGQVVLSDVVPEMTAIAAARADAAGIANVLTRELDLERIDEPDSSYDVVLCREGLMLVLDPAQAVREMRRVLRPGGRLALAVWGPRERNPWLGVLFDAVTAELGAPVPPPGVPGPFSLENAGRLAGLLDDAGLAEVDVHELPTPYAAASFDEWWTRTVALAGPIAKMLAALPEDKAAGLRDRAREGISKYETGHGQLDIPGVSLIASGVRTED